MQSGNALWAEGLKNKQLELHIYACSTPNASAFGGKRGLLTVKVQLINVFTSVCVCVRIVRKFKDSNVAQREAVDSKCSLGKSKERNKYIHK